MAGCFRSPLLRRERRNKGQTNQTQHNCGSSRGDRQRSKKSGRYYPERERARVVEKENRGGSLPQLQHNSKTKQRPPRSTATRSKSAPASKGYLNAKNLAALNEAYIWEKEKTRYTSYAMQRFLVDMAGRQEMALPSIIAR